MARPTALSWLRFTIAVVGIPGMIVCWGAGWHAMAAACWALWLTSYVRWVWRHGN